MSLLQTPWSTSKTNPQERVHQAANMSAEKLQLFLSLII